VKALNPSYQLPGRNAISKNMIPALYEHCLNAVQEKMDSVKSACITTDCWISRNVDSYLAVTAHYITEDFSLNSVLIGFSLITGSHTSENLAENEEHDRKFKLSNKILIAVTDNASNIKKAINSHHLQWKHFGCYAHTLNLIVQDSLEDVQELVNKLKTIVAHFKRSTTANVKN
jgi:DNA-binding PucR family transcriptional regulator